MSRPTSAFLLSAALLCACQGSSPGPSQAGRAPAVSAKAAESPNHLTDEAMRSIEAGDLEHARGLLDELLLSDHLERARNELLRGSPEDALTAVDLALGLAPDSAEVRLLKADSSLRLAEAKILSGGASAGLIEGALEDALRYYEGMGESAHSLFGASRAAWLLGDTAKALDFARRGQSLREARHSLVEELGIEPERIYAEQLVAACARARGEEDGERDALVLECEDALAKLLGRESTDPWAWSQLADLYEGEDRLREAKDSLERGLLRAPEDAGLLARLARVSRSFEGPAATVLAFEAYARTHGNSPLAQWHLTVARFMLALDSSKQTPPVLDPTPFESAEAAFRALGERAPEFDEAARGYEVVCRLARGWCALHRGELELAQREFLSMNEIYPRGVEWTMRGELESGIQGLFLVADAYQAREDGLAAAQVFETLHELQPDSYLWANNAGLFLRDAADALKSEGENLCKAAHGWITNAEALEELRGLAGIPQELRGTEEERSSFLRGRDERFRLARELMERSWKAYRPAAEQVPEDVRVVNDAALVLVYYLHHDLLWAEEQLLRCVEMGKRQVEAKKAELAAEESPERASELEAELDQLTEAWGDAHQNLGVLEWIHRKNATAALAWLEQSIAIWPERQPVTNSLLPQIRGELEPTRHDHWDLLHWAQPCRH